MLYGECKIKNFSKWKQQSKQTCCVWTAAAWFLSPAPLCTGLSCNLERSLCRPQVQRVHEAYFRWACLDRPTKALNPPTPLPPYHTYSFFSPPLLLKRTPCRPRLSQRLQWKYIMCKKNSIWCHTICVILSQLIKKVTLHSQLCSLWKAW